MKIKGIIVNTQNNEIEEYERDATAEEIAEAKRLEKLNKELQDELKVHEAARAALLDKLGITADEAKLLLS